MVLKTKLFHWLPRTLGVMTVLFIGILSGIRFDGASFSNNEWSIMMNVFPALIVTLILVYSYYRELTGGIIIILSGLFLIYVFTKNTSPIQKVSIHGLVSCILLIITGFFFVISYFLKKKGVN